MALPPNHVDDRQQQAEPTMPLDIMSTDFTTSMTRIVANHTSHSKSVITNVLVIIMEV
jgi:hypothetical protein